MPITENEMQTWCENLLGDASETSLQEYLISIPKLDSLADLPSGTPVLIRGDVDAKPGDVVGEGDIRLRSMLETLKFGQAQGWKMIVFGHIGRKPDGTLAKVASRIGELVGENVALVTDWLDESTMTINASVTEAIESLNPGGILVLENTRQYDVERALWKATLNELPELAPKLAKLSNEFATKVANVYVHEALAAGSMDASSTVVPAAMDRIALGKYIASEFSGPMMRCLETRLVVFSGLKIDKLDDLEAMISRGTIKRVFAAGSLAMALRKAIAELDGVECCIGAAEDPAHADKPYYIPQDRVEQAKRMVSDGREKDIEFIVPVDSIIEDGSAKDILEPADQQFDIGPKTRELFEEKVTEFLRGNIAGAVAFHNGVFGMFEDPRFEEGTRHFIGQLKRMTDAGVEVYVGGGEGGKALERYGKPEWVKHVFTAGGTVLNALGTEPVPYLVALRAAAERAAV